MGRYLSSIGKVKTNIDLNGVVSINKQAPGFMGIFGTGQWNIFRKSGTFKVPPNIFKIRVRVVGAGGGANSNSYGGAGGGYAHGVFNVTPGDTYTVTVGLGGTAPTPLTGGGTSSFSSLISATGGGASLSTGTSPTPGIGIGGDFQAKGGTSILYGGGGAAGSQLGDGGSGLCPGGGGGGVGGNDALGKGGASAFGPSYRMLTTETPSNTQVHLGNNWRDGAPDISGRTASYTGVISFTGESDESYLYASEGLNYSLKVPVRFPFDAFVGGGGCMNGTSTYSDPLTFPLSLGGDGAGGGAGIHRASSATYRGGRGGVGGGGGVSMAPVSIYIPGGDGGIGGGAGTSMTISTDQLRGASGGNGLVIVEW